MMRTKKIKIRCRDGVWQTWSINPDNLYKLRMRHGEENVVDLEDKERRCLDGL